MYNLNKIKIEAYNQESKHLKRMIKETKEKKIFNFSPSEFAFSFESCKRCFYDKKVNGIELKTFFPAMFSKFDSMQKNYYHSKSSKEISDDLEEGEIISNYNKMLKSEVLYDLKENTHLLFF